MQLKKILSKKEGLVALVFVSEWSGASLMMKPIFKCLLKTYAPMLDIFEIDTDIEKTTSAQFQIRRLPSILFFKNGQLIAREDGIISKQKLIQKIEVLLQQTSTK